MTLSNTSPLRPSVSILSTLFAIAVAAGVANAATAGSPDRPAAAATLDPHAAHIRFRFRDPTMDFVFGSLVLGAAVNHGSEIGEAFATAQTIVDGDAASWRAAWLRTAPLLEARGERALTGNHRVSARDQFMRAGYAYRIALAAMLPDDPLFLDTARRSRTLMKRAGELLEPKLEYIEISFDGTLLPGYFRKAAPGDEPARTLIMIGGAETFAEDQYFYIAPQAFERGYNFLTVDLPGQGLLPREGRAFRSDIEMPLKAVVDYALSRRDVDRDRLAVYGISSGGGFVPQAAAHDRRISAIVMNNCVVEAGAGVAKMAVATATPDIVAGWSSFAQVANRLIAWRFGLDMNDLPGLVAANRNFRFDPAAVTSPALILVAGGEMKSEEIQRQNRLCLDGLANPRKSLVVTPAAEGAANHVVMENRSLMAQEVFDWLDETFAGGTTDLPAK
ncbi:alpha/beta hydrolase [Xanthobacteraceae bacterium Astr-EGSB]|uniref:alpha/beta hydrolase family protein n=1 Tax=Astrobacterium formosum TaxID=3069710 RepID=UPI0027B5756F|nr:alpha/beta hydrolase [Xanthobacteraceae bacterium Astr-EGSB]